MNNDQKLPTEPLYPELLSVSASPHIHAKDTTMTVMRDVLIALIPASLWGVFRFGFRALVLILVTVAACVFFEWGFEKLTKRRVTIGDLSAAVTGLILALNLPVTFPIPMAVAGAFFAIVVVKQVFGGIGKNVFNPALAARVFLMLAWPSAMTAFTKTVSGLTYVDATSSATPLASFGDGKLSVSILDLFLGNTSGVIGEVSALLIILGGIYLLVRKVITWHIPVAYIGTVAVVTLVFPRVSGAFNSVGMAAELFAGGLMFGAFFMATDYVTSPVTKVGRLIFGVGCGLITVFIRYFGGYSEGVSFAILIMNALVWYLDKLGKPKVFGDKTLKKWKKEAKNGGKEAK